MNISGTAQFPEWEILDAPAKHRFTDLQHFYKIEGLLPAVLQPQPQAMPASVREVL